MKLNIKKLAFVSLLGLSLTSCEDFLNKPTEDSYNLDNYYQNADQCEAGVNYLYNSPWYDFQRGFIKVGEVFSGNYYWGSSPYMTFTVNGSDEDLKNMSYSLWAVIGHANTVYQSIANSPVDQVTKDKYMGECLVWKAMAYFFLVRSFGDIPIVHNTSEVLGTGTYNEMTKVRRADVYEYILMTLEKACGMLPKTSDKGRIDYYSAMALMAKVYLTKAGVSGSLNQHDLDMAASCAWEIIRDVQEGRTNHKLEAKYEDAFTLANRYTPEALISWRWTADGSHWTRQNTLQSDLGINGIDDQGATWGGWNGISVDLQEAFGIKILEQQPDAWINNVDTRLHGTVMLPGFKYTQFWQDKGGFDYLWFIYNASANMSLESATGANTVKHIYGNTYDHVTGCGVSDGRMANSLPTHLLRLADVYLIYAEAKLGAGRAASSDDSVIDAFYAVRKRAIPNATRPSSVSWEDIWKERRLEMAMEGDRWYDYVRVSYYDPEFCVNELVHQKRNSYWGLDGLYKTYSETGQWAPNSSDQGYDETTGAPDVSSLMKADPESGKKYFFLPMSAEDVLFNPNLGSDVNGEAVNVREIYEY